MPKKKACEDQDCNLNYLEYLADQVKGLAVLMYRQGKLAENPVDQIMIAAQILKEEFADRQKNNRKANNHYVRSAVHSWYIDRKTFCLIENQGQGDQYLVRVIPDGRDAESYWLNDGQSWETESGAAWSILNSLDEQ